MASVGQLSGFGLTVAVNVTLSPSVDGFKDEATLTVGVLGLVELSITSISPGCVVVDIAATMSGLLSPLKSATWTLELV